MKIDLSVAFGVKEDQEFAIKENSEDDRAFAYCIRHNQTYIYRIHNNQLEYVAPLFTGEWKSADFNINKLVDVEIVILSDFGRDRRTQA